MRAGRSCLRVNFRINVRYPAAKDAPRIGFGGDAGPAANVNLAQPCKLPVIAHPHALKRDLA